MPHVIISPELLLLGQQTSQAEIVDNVFNFLDLVLDAIATLSQRIILQVQDLEAGVHILDELGNLHRPPVISQCDRVPRKTRQLVEQRDQTLKVLLDGEVESIAILKIDRHAKDAAHVVQSQQLAAGGVHAAEVAAEQNAEHSSLHFAGPGVAVLVVGVLRSGLGKSLNGSDLFVNALASSDQDIGDLNYY